MRKNALIRSLVVAALAGLGQAATAALVYNSNGFENPPFTAGTVVGQDNWTQSGGTGSSGNVQNAGGVSNSHSLLVTRGGAGVTSDVRYWPAISSVTPTLTNNLVNVDWDMNVAQASGAQSFGPFMGIEAYDQNNNRIAAWGVDAFTAELLFEDPNSTPTPGAFNTTTNDDTVSLGAFHHYTLSMDYTAHTVKLSVDGSLKQTVSGFLSTGVTTFSDADVSALAADANHLDETGSAIFDNYVVVNTSVPEPTALAAVATGLLLLRRRMK
jgi:hypothetical protein